MFHVAAVSLGSLVLGGLLAQFHAALPVRAGLIGLVLMLGGALAVRRHWRSARADAGPGSPERELWHSLSTTALIAGQLLMSLFILGPGMALHSVAAHAMAIDNWTLVLGALLSFRIARDPDPRSDERDSLFAARATRIAYATLSVELILVAVTLAFGADFGLAALSQSLIAHLLIGCQLIAWATRCGAQLAMYETDRRLLRESA